VERFETVEHDRFGEVSLTATVSRGIVETVFLEVSLESDDSNNNHNNSNSNSKNQDDIYSAVPSS